MHTNNPDLTPCFQNSLLAWVPCIYLWAALPWYLFYLRHHDRGYIILSHLSRLKTVGQGTQGSPVGRAGIWKILPIVILLPPNPPPSVAEQFPSYTCPVTQGHEPAGKSAVK